MANTYLTRTTTTPTLGTKFSCSAWIKISEVPAGGGSDRWLFGEFADNNNHSYLYLRNSSAIGWYEKDGGSSVVSKITNKLCRDMSGWYHFMVAFDTTDGTAEDRFKLYINGERITDWGTNSPATYSQNATPRMNSNNQLFCIGGTASYQSNFVGSMSHMHFCDGTALAPTVFGSTDSTTGNWKINAAPSFTPGNNGFTIMKDGNTITDQSANSNNFTLAGGTLTKTQDCPSNVFATFNSLFHDHANTNSTFTNGNTAVQPQSNGSYTYAVSTLGMPKGNGKFYFEAKYVQYDDVEAAVGIVEMDKHQELFYENRPVVTASNTTAIGRVILNADGHSIIAGTANSSYGFGSWANNDVICMACDMENGAFYFRKNGGSWANSGNPESGSTKTGAIDISATSQWTSSNNWGIWVGDAASGGYDKFSMNFGNGYFGTTAISSAGTNASNNGLFEYDVPAGYTALSTKGLNL